MYIPKMSMDANSLRLCDMLKHRDGGGGMTGKDDIIRA